MKKGGAGDAGGGREYFGRKLLWRKTRDFGLEVHLCCWKNKVKLGTDTDMKVMVTFLNRMVIYCEKRI